MTGLALCASLPHANLMLQQLYMAADMLGQTWYTFIHCMCIAIVQSRCKLTTTLSNGSSLSEERVHVADAARHAIIVPVVIRGEDQVRMI